MQQYQVGAGPLTAKVSLALYRFADRIRGSFPRQLLFAVTCVAIAVLARLALDYMVPGRLTYITFYPAVFIVAFTCGLRIATAMLLVVSLLGGLWTADETVFVRAVGIIAFTVIGAFVVLFGHGYCIALSRLREKDEQVATINRELSHRIKNLFSVAASVSQQTIKSSADLESAAKAVGGRLKAIATAQDFLNGPSQAGADLRDLLATIVEPMAPCSSQLHMQGEKAILPASATTPFALILNELATNSLKHGAWTSVGGRVETAWQVTNGALQFSWREQLDSVVIQTGRVGLGTRLIQNGLGKGRVKFETGSHMVSCDIVLPLDGPLS